MLSITVDWFKGERLAMFAKKLNEDAAVKALKDLKREHSTNVQTANSSFATAIYSGLILEELREMNKKLDDLLDK